jgi:hypothetical protein
MITLQQGTIYLGTAAPASGGGGSVSYDNSTINENSSNQLQTIAVINKNTAVGATNPLNLWEGTESQWNNGVSQTWYNWQSGSASGWSSVTMPLSPTSNAVYGNNKFIVFGTDNSATTVMTSTDGTTWSSTDVSTDVTDEIVSVAYGNNLFVALGWENAYYSSNGTSWTKVALSSATYLKVYYGGGQFTIVADDGTILYSTDGSTWATATSPSTSVSTPSYCYGNGKHFISVDNTNYLISSDGVNWTQQTVNDPITIVAYNNGTFYGYGGSKYTPNYSYTSTDLINWTPIENSDKIVTGASKSLIYSDKFYMISHSYTGLHFVSSIDFIHWQIDNNMPSSVSTFSINKEYLSADGNGNILVISDDANSAFLRSSGTVLSVFTTESAPTTSSQVYSAPNTTSALTITSVGTGTITLSDTNTYNYNASGNQTTTQTVGEAHPDWLCFIEGVGVKKGTTTIASIAPTVDQTYNAASTNAQSGVAVASGISDSLGTINTQLESIIAQGD